MLKKSPSIATPNRDILLRAKDESIDYFMTTDNDGSLKYDRKRHNKSTVDHPGLYSRGPTS